MAAPEHSPRHAQQLAAVVRAEPRGRSAEQLAMAMLAVLLLGAVLFVVVQRWTGDATASSSTGAHPASDHTTPQTVAAPVAVAPAKVVAPAGVQLAVGRIVAAPDPVDGGVLIRARTTNLGTQELVGSAGDVRAVLLVDGAVTDSVALGPVGGEGAHTDVRFSVPACTSGRHSVTVVVDATARVHEVDEADDVRTTELTFGC